MPPRKKEVVKVQLTFTKGQMNIIRSYEEIFGRSDAEIVRAIVMIWLASENKSERGGKNEN